MARKKRMILIVNGGDSEVLLPTPFAGHSSGEEGGLCRVMNLARGYALPIMENTPNAWSGLKGWVADWRILANLVPGCRAQTRDAPQ
jgi:hypothetical protein